MKNEEIYLTGAIVLYKNKINVLNETIKSFMNTPLSKKLFLIDNSPSDALKNEFTHPDIEYEFLNGNIGFGSAHNKVINKIKNKSTYHLILNPDVSFNSQVIPKLIEAVDSENNISIISPRVIYPDGKHQYTCRKFPGLFELIMRRSGFLKKAFPFVITKGEYRDLDLSEPFYPDFVMGCFQLFKTKDFVSISGFDERYFMYMEDVDICRKLVSKNKKILYYPKEEIIHLYKKGSSKNINLFKHHILSIFKYFYKWNITYSNNALKK